MAEVVCQKDYKFELPGKLNIYRLRRPEITQDAIRRVGGRFGLRTTSDSASFTLNARGIAYSDASPWGLRLFRHSGGWQYRHRARWQADDRKGHIIIEDDEAAGLARDAIGRYALPVEPELERVRVERLNVAHAERGAKTHEQRIIGVRVLFRRVVDSLPVEGPGGSTVVYIDHERELTGIDHLWHDIEDVYEPVRRLRPVDEALQEVRRRYGTGDGRVEVTDIRLAYFELGWDQYQEFLQPAYVVFLQVGNGRVRMNARVPVAAAFNAVGPIEPARAARELQELRIR